MNEPKRLKDLIKLLDMLRQYQSQLLALIQQKMQAMKRADITAMHDLGAREHGMIERLQEREGLRRQLMGLIGEEIGLSTQVARNLTVTQLASYLPQASKDALTTTATALRDVALKVTKVNRLVGVMAREVVNHLTWVFSAVRPESGEPVVYTGNGAPAVCARPRLFDTVG